MSLMTLLAHPYTIVLARWLVGATLLVAGIGKLLDVRGSLQAIASVPIVPRPFTRAVAVGLPWAEIAAGVGLLAGLWTAEAGVLAAILFAIFSTVTAVNLIRGRNLDCHCFGAVYHSRVSVATVARNVCLLALSTQVVFFATDYLTIDGWLRPATTAVSAQPPVTGLLPIVSAVVAVAIAGLLGATLWKTFRSQGM